MNNLIAGHVVHSFRFKDTRIKV